MIYGVTEEFKGLFGETIELNGFEKAIASYNNSFHCIAGIDEALENENDIEEFFCPVCGRKASIRHNRTKDSCFVSRWHKPSCRLYLSHSKKKKTNNIIVGTYIDLKKAIRPSRKLTKRAQKYQNYKNSIIEQKRTAGNTIPSVENEEDQSLKEMIKVLSATRSIYIELKDKDDSYKFGEGIRKDSFLLDSRGLYNAKKKGIRPNDPKMAITERILPSTLAHPFQFPEDYILLKDRFSSTENSSIFFLARIIDENGETNQLENDAFQYYVRGHGRNGEVIESLPKDRHDTILLMGHRWQEIPSDDYTIYVAEIYSDDYDFINY